MDEKDEFDLDVHLTSGDTLGGAKLELGGPTSSHTCAFIFGGGHTCAATCSHTCAATCSHTCAVIGGGGHTCAATCSNTCAAGVGGGPTCAATCSNTCQAFGT